MVGSLVSISISSSFIGLPSAFSISLVVVATVAKVSGGDGDDGGEDEDEEDLQSCRVPSRL